MKADLVRNGGLSVVTGELVFGSKHLGLKVGYEDKPLCLNALHTRARAGGVSSLIAIHALFTKLVWLLS